MRRFFNLVLGAMVMMAVALFSAFIAMRLAIHGREVTVPDLTHMTIAEASHRAASAGLRLRLENKFYSPDTPAGMVLAQFPAPGTIVRREWPVRVTESLGTQQVAIPDLMGQGERAASIHLRQLGLELETVGHIAAPEPEGIVVAQTPPPNATGVDAPRVSILLSEPQDEAEQAYVMPSLVGLSMAAAYARATAAGLRVASIEDVTPSTAAASTAPVQAPTTPALPTAGSATPTQLTSSSPALTSAGIVVAQTPLAGHRVLKGDVVRLALTHESR